MRNAGQSLENKIESYPKNRRSKQRSGDSAKFEQYLSKLIYTGSSRIDSLSHHKSIPVVKVCPKPIVLTERSFKHNSSEAYLDLLSSRMAILKENRLLNSRERFKQNSKILVEPKKLKEYI